MRGKFRQIVLPVVLALLFSFGVPLRATTAEALDAPQLKGIRLTAVADGKNADAASLITGRPSCVVFVTPVCRMCKDQLRFLDGLSGSNVAVVAVFSGGLERERLLAILREEWGVRSVPAYVDESGALFRAFRIEGAPSSVLFDARGRQLRFIEGFPGGEAFQAALRQLGG